MELICPICGASLQRQGQTYGCAQRHSFDIARQGYVNLLPVQHKHSLQPGDTRQQVLARREFLEAGFYSPILAALEAAALRHGAQGPILDIGCGEGYYSSHLAQTLGCGLVGLDISKEAVRCAAAKYKTGLWICATASRIPVAEQSFGIVTSLFALTQPQEFFRCLKPGGLFLQVLAGEDHLLGLKSIIYPRLLEKEKNPAPEVPGFTMLESIPVRFSFRVEGAQVGNLLSMTPHAHRITKEGAARLAQTETLTDTASCVINVYRVNKE